jgi:GT2 family glycosyltransferase
MSSPAQAISVVIPTYRRGEILLSTLQHLFSLDPLPGEILVVDQTESHPASVALELVRLAEEGRIRRLALAPPSIPRAMNAGLLSARGEVVLFLDDDIVPRRDLVERHGRAHAEHPEAWAVAGQVIQPEDEPSSGARPRKKGASFLSCDLDFPFNSAESAWVENVMAGNLSLKREKALAMGGFDVNFIPPVSFRFETEFAKRLVTAGGKIYFEPRASVRHLREKSGGSRSKGGHLASASPVHGAGDYYYALRWGRGWARAWHIARRPFREVCTKFHLTHPWYIPVKLIGEIRAIRLAFKLNKAGPKLVRRENEGNP